MPHEPTQRTYLPPDPYRFLPAGQGPRIDLRHATCRVCERFGGATALTVRCNECGCSGLSFTQGRCPKGKW